MTDQRFVNTEDKVDARQVELPMHSAVMEQIGKPIVFNICMLGVTISLTRVVQPESILKVLQERIPEGFLELNQKALNLGIEMGAAVKI